MLITWLPPTITDLHHWLVGSTSVTTVQMCLHTRYSESQTGNLFQILQNVKREAPDPSDIHPVVRKNIFGQANSLCWMLSFASHSFWENSCYRSGHRSERKGSTEAVRLAEIVYYRTGRWLLNPLQGSSSLIQKWVILTWPVQFRLISRGWIISMILATKFRENLYPGR